MPISVGGAEQLPQKVVGILPDLNDPFLTEEELPIRALIKMEIPNNEPGNIPGFEDLPPEEQARIVGKYRFFGIRLRQDLAKNATVPIKRETMELP